MTLQFIFLVLVMSQLLTESFSSATGDIRTNETEKKFAPVAIQRATSGFSGQYGYPQRSHNCAYSANIAKVPSRKLIPLRMRFLKPKPVPATLSSAFDSGRIHEYPASDKSSHSDTYRDAVQSVNTPEMRQAALQIVPKELPRRDPFLENVLRNYGVQVESVPETQVKNNASATENESSSVKSGDEHTSPVLTQNAPDDQSSEVSLPKPTEQTSQAIPDGSEETTSGKVTVTSEEDSESATPAQPLDIQLGANNSLESQKSPRTERLVDLTPGKIYIHDLEKATFEEAPDTDGSLERGRRLREKMEDESLIELLKNYGIDGLSILTSSKTEGEEVGSKRPSNIEKICNDRDSTEDCEPLRTTSNFEYPQKKTESPIEKAHLQNETLQEIQPTVASLPALPSTDHQGTLPSLYFFEQDHHSLLGNNHNVYADVPAMGQSAQLLNYSGNGIIHVYDISSPYNIMDPSNAGGHIITIVWKR